jgi:hypothetical protein
VWHHHGHAATAGLEGLDHVQDEGVVALGSGRHAALVAVELVVLGLVVAPLLQRERRIGDHHVEVLEGVVRVQQPGVAQGVAPFDAVVVLAVQEHIHLGQCPGTADGLLAEQGVFLRAVEALADLASALHQQRAGATGRVADLVAFLRLHQFGDQVGDLGRRVELAGLLAGAGGEVLDQELVGVADHVQLADAAGRRSSSGLAKVFQQVTQDVVLGASRRRACRR